MRPSWTVDGGRWTVRIRIYLGNLWHAIRGTPHYVPDRRDIQRIKLEVNTGEAAALIDELQAKVEKLRGSIEAVNDELGLISMPTQHADD